MELTWAEYRKIQNELRDANYTISQLLHELGEKDTEIEKLRSGFRRIIEVNEAYQIEEYGRPVRDTIEMTIARAALKGDAS